MSKIHILTTISSYIGGIGTIVLTILNHNLSKNLETLVLTPYN